MNIDPQLVLNSPNGGSLVLNTPKLPNQKKNRDKSLKQSYSISQSVTNYNTMKTISTDSSNSKVGPYDKRKIIDTSTSPAIEMKFRSQIERELRKSEVFSGKRKFSRPKTSNSYDGFFTKIFKEKNGEEELDIDVNNLKTPRNSQKKSEPQIISTKYVHLSNTSGISQAIKESIKSSNPSTFKKAEKNLRLLIVDTPPEEMLRLSNTNIKPFLGLKQNAKTNKNGPQTATSQGGDKREDEKTAVMRKDDASGKGNRRYERKSRGEEGQEMGLKREGDQLEKVEKIIIKKGSQMENEGDSCEEDESNSPTNGNNDIDKRDELDDHGAGYKNKFSKVDSKYEEIIELKKKNTLLEKKLKDLRTELDKIDEFQLVMHFHTREKDLNGEAFNEKRVNFLKAQIEKQRRYIMKVNATLKLCKKFQRDFVSFLKIFQGLSKKYENLAFLNKKEKNSIRRPDPKDDKIMLTELDILMKRNALNKLLKRSMENPDDLIEKFVNNFNEAYEKVLLDERKNEEFKRLFHINKNEKDQTREVKYSYPMKDFTHKYKKYFPIATIFDAMEPSDKESTDSMLSKVMNLANKIEEKFSQLSNFCLLKTNPFFYSEKMPEFVMNNIDLYTKFINSMNQRNFLKIKLDYTEIANTESGLNSLLNRLCHFHEQMNYKREEISINDVSHLKQELRENIENLLHLGITLNKQSTELLLVNKLYNVSPTNKDEPKRELGARKSFMASMVNQEPNINIDHDMDSLTKQASNLFNLPHSTSSKKLGQPNLTSVEKSLNTLDVKIPQENNLPISQRRSILKDASNPLIILEASAQGLDSGKLKNSKSTDNPNWDFPIQLYKKEDECDLSFTKASEGLKGLLTDLMTAYNQDDFLKKNLTRVRFLIDRIVVFYEQKRVTGLIKDSDLEMTQKTLLILETGSKQLSEFVQEKLDKALSFLVELDQKSQETLSIFDEYISCVNQSLKDKIFNRFSIFFRKFIQKCRSEARELESVPLKNKKLELKDLKNRIEERVRNLNERWKFFQWKNRKIFEGGNEDIRS